MKIENRGYPSGRVIKVEGEINLSCANELKEPVTEALEDGMTVIDLSQVKFIDSFGLGVLISFAKKPFNRGLFRIAGPQGHVERTIKLSRLDRILAIFPTLNDALKAPCPRRIVVIDPDDVTLNTVAAVLESYDYTIQSVAEIGDLANGRPDLIIAAASTPGLAEYRKAFIGKADDGTVIAAPPLLLMLDAVNDELNLSSDPTLIRSIEKPFEPYDILGHTRALLGEIVGGGSRILGCIKDPAAAEEIEYILSRHGYRFTNHAKFAAAVEEMENGEFKALLISLEPGGVTLEKAISLLKNLPDLLPIVIVGSPPTQQEVLKIIKMGISDIVGVPISPEALLGKMAKNIP